MPIAIVLFIFPLLQLLPASAQTSPDGIAILNRKLKWSDFTGKVDESSPFSAMTYWWIRYYYSVRFDNTDTGTIQLQVTPFFQAKSWVKSGEASNQLLQHEQGHYDIAIICADSFRTAIASHTFLRSNYSTKIDSVFQSILHQFQDMELRYDEETNHMLKVKEQRRWNAILGNLLQKNGTHKE